MIGAIDNSGTDMLKITLKISLRSCFHQSVPGGAKSVVHLDNFWQTIFLKLVSGWFSDNQNPPWGFLLIFIK